MLAYSTTTLSMHHANLSLPIAHSQLLPRCDSRVIQHHQHHTSPKDLLLPVLHQHQHHHLSVASASSSTTSNIRTQQDEQQQQRQQEDDEPSTSGRTDGIIAACEAAAPGSLVTFEEVQEIATARGLHLSLKTLGPFYRITCRDGGPEGRVFGVTNGFVAPLFGLMHCDTLQIFTRGLTGQEGGRVRKNALGLGLLLGGAVFSYGRSCGCSKAEILAINDDDDWHERLVRYYSFFGFKPVCTVGGQGFLQDVPHLLVWGGEGTRMDADIDAALQRWTPALRQSRKKASARQLQQQQQQ